jgi:hypothetical protein
MGGMSGTTVGLFLLAGAPTEACRLIRPSSSKSSDMVRDYLWCLRKVSAGIRGSLLNLAPRQTISGKISKWFSSDLPSYRIQQSAKSSNDPIRTLQ